MNNLKNYRRLVRQVFCSYCGAYPGFACGETIEGPFDGDDEWVRFDYVHDDRSAVYHEETALPLLSPPLDDDWGQVYVDTSPPPKEASDALLRAFNVTIDDPLDDLS